MLELDDEIGLEPNLRNASNDIVEPDNRHVATGGEMLLLLERSKKVLTRTITAKSEDQAIREDNFISPAGRILNLTFYLIYFDLYRTCSIPQEPCYQWIKCDWSNGVTWRNKNGRRTYMGQFSRSDVQNPHNFRFHY